MSFTINNITISSVNDLKELIENDKTILQQNFSFKYLKSTYYINIYLYISIYGTQDMLKYVELYLNDIKIYKDDKNNDAYLLASYHGNLEIMKYLETEHNWDITVKNNIGNDAYLNAASNGQLKIMKYLEEKYNWDISIKNNERRGVCYLSYKFPKILKHLLKKN